MPEQLPYVNFAEARDYFRSLVPMTDEEWLLVAEEIQARAFTVANVTSMNALLGVYNSLGKRFTDGITFTDFQQEILADLADNGWVGPQPWQLENVFDTNIQSAYGYGRLKQHTEMIDFYPYGEYVDVGDDKVRAWHRELRGQIHLMDSEFWQTHYPPWEFR